MTPGAEPDLASSTEQPATWLPRRPAWLPNYIPELQGIRGFAILWVVLYHSNARLKGTWLFGGAIWGWSGVILFFILSGFLITANLLTARDKEHYFHNFHARRAIRIWPVYLLVLIVVYLNSPWFIGPGVWDAVRTAPWWAYLLFIQNLFHLSVPAALYPTWALAIEEQYYFFWAPAVRWLRHPWMLVVPLCAALGVSPWLKLHYMSHPWLNPVHSLIHLDGLALGSLLAIAMYSFKLGRRVWFAMGAVACVVGIWAAGTIAGGTAFLDSALTLGFGGAILVFIASTGKRNPLSAALSRGPLAYLGQISYGLYLFHIASFVFIGAFDIWIDKAHPGIVGNLAIVALRLVVAIGVASAIWRWVETPILKLKSKF